MSVHSAQGALAVDEEGRGRNKRSREVWRRTDRLVCAYGCSTEVNGNVRLCVDLTKLNKGVRRELYVMKKVEETLGSISSRTVFSKLDANSGFHKVKLTMFITQFGRFMFRRLPYGISSAPEYFQKRMDKELSGLQGVLYHMDDILVIGRNKEEHDERLVKVLQRLKDSGITLNPDKCLFFTSRLQYLGQVINSNVIRKDAAKVKAIT